MLRLPSGHPPPLSPDKKPGSNGSAVRPRFRFRQEDYIIPSIVRPADEVEEEGGHQGGSYHDYAGYLPLGALVVHLLQSLVEFGQFPLDLGGFRRHPDRVDLVEQAVVAVPHGEEALVRRIRIHTLSLEPGQPVFNPYDLAFRLFHGCLDLCRPLVGVATAAALFIDQFQGDFPDLMAAVAGDTGRPTLAKCPAMGAL